MRAGAGLEWGVQRPLSRVQHLLLRLAGVRRRGSRDRATLSSQFAPRSQADLHARALEISVDSRPDRLRIAPSLRIPCNLVSRAVGHAAQRVWCVARQAPLEMP